jgi:short-subunit dehydrogenase
MPVRQESRVATPPISPSRRRLALVTGASSGIGFELAREFASHGFDLIVAAEDEAILAAASELAAFGTSVEPAKLDLSAPGGVDALHARIRSTGRPLAAAALNAGVGVHGAFASETSLERELGLIDLNVRSTVHLAKFVASDMVRRGEGRVLFTSSDGAAVPGPYQAVYNASKSFVHSFSLALREELVETGVTVTTLVPGPTDTPFFERSDIPSAHLRRDDPAGVARAGFEALVRGDRLAIPFRPHSDRLRSRVRSRVGRMVPGRAKAALRRRTSRAVFH